MDLSNIWLIVASDGDIDYTSVYVAEGATTEAEAQAIMEEIIGAEEDPYDDYSYRVLPLRSLNALKEDFS